MCCLDTYNLSPKADLTEVFIYVREPVRSQGICFTEQTFRTLLQKWLSYRAQRNPKGSWRRSEELQRARAKAPLWSECLYPSQIHVETLMPNRMIEEGRAFVRYLGHEGGTLMGSVFSSKRPYRSPSPLLLPCEDTRRKCMLFIRERALTRT